jgi:replication factor C subunit 1
MNASDTRSASSMKEDLFDITTTTILSFSKKAKGDKPTRRVIIMDEVDGMSSGDRGGAGELVKIIKSSKTPIICICNDRQANSAKTIIGACFDVKFTRPMKESIAKKALEICTKEGLKIEMNALTLLAESVGNDIRQVLNSLEMMKRSSNKEILTYVDMKDKLETIKKDDVLRFSGFDGAQSILNSRIPLAKRMEAFFIDHDIIPLLVQENYPNAVGGSKAEELHRLSAAADAIVDGDLCNRYIRYENNWGLLPTLGALTASVGYHCGANLRGMVAFTSALGKMSTTSKMKRLIREISFHCSGKISGGNDVVLMDYIPALKDALLLPLVNRGSDGAEDTMKILETYSLSRDDLMESMKEFHYGDEGRDLYKEIDSKAKAAFTRLYNTSAHMTMGLSQGMAAHDDDLKAFQKKKGK